MNGKNTFLVFSIFLPACVPLSPVSTPIIDTPLAPNETVIIAPSETNTPLTENGRILANCPLFPANNIWNASVDSLPTHMMSDAWIDSVGSAESFHMDFGSGTWDGTCLID